MFSLREFFTTYGTPKRELTLLRNHLHSVVGAETDFTLGTIPVSAFNTPTTSVSEGQNQSTGAYWMVENV